MLTAWFVYSTQVMKASFLILVITFCASNYVSAEYKVCATSDYESFCKYIEASSKEVTCVKVQDSVDCLLKMQKKEADFGSFTSEELFLVAKFLGDAATVVAEVRHPDKYKEKFFFETVAVVRSNFQGGLSALKGLTYCHPGFSKAQYWSDRILKDFENKVLEHFKDDVKCSPATLSADEDHLNRLKKVFSKACRPGTWSVWDWWDKKLKRDYHSLCEQCEHSATCSYKVQNSGKHSGALRCLTLNGGNVTYTASDFVKEYFELDYDNHNEFSHKHPSKFMYLCPDGTTRSLTSEHCAWIKQPWMAVISLSSTYSEISRDLKEWLEPEEGKAEHMTWTNYLGNILSKKEGVFIFRNESIKVANYIKEGRSIPSPDEEFCKSSLKWCAINTKEKRKCDYVSSAALTHGLQNRIQCVEGSSSTNCLKKVANREADFLYSNPRMGYISRKLYNLTAAAFLETQRTGNYYGVAVVKGNSIKTFKSLQGKKACFPQYNGLGWLTFVQALKNFSIISQRSCFHSWKIWTYFSGACAPGAMDSNFNAQIKNVPDRLCKSCTNAAAGSSCEANTQNPYFGEVGALQCLNNEDGDVAFLDFFTIQRYLITQKDEKNSKINIDNFKILCRDGSVQDFNMTYPDKCSFTQLNGGEVVVRKDLDEVEKTNIYGTIMELDDLYGTTSRNYNPVLKMFEPFDEEHNLLFPETAVALVSSSYETQNSFVNNYKQLLSTLEYCYGESSSIQIMPSIFCIVVSILFVCFL